MIDIGIIGGGPAGIAAALTAAYAGTRVTIIEHMPRIGKKLLITGSGKCNISNEDMSLNHYHSNNPECIEAIFDGCPADETLLFLRYHGLLLKSRNGYYYPFCEQASAVVDSLRLALKDSSVRLLTDTNIRELEYKSMDSKPFKLFCDNGTFSFNRLIIASGAKSYEKTGSDGSGYDFAKYFGHRIIKPLPALTSLNCEEKFYQALAGIRTKATINIQISDKNDSSKKQEDYCETGELQLTKTGISGIPVFNLSCFAVRALDEKKSVRAIIDFMPDLDYEGLRITLRERVSVYPQRELEYLFTGILHKNLASQILKRCGYRNASLNSSLREKDIDRIVNMTKSFDTKIISYGGFDNAQVTSGGVKLTEIKPSMESKLIDNLYFAGEILDVDGKCGGYNLHFAFTSGIIAGRNASASKS